MSLSEDLRAIVAPIQGTVGVFARNLGTHETVALNAEEILPTESAAKTFVLLDYSRQVKAGTCDPARRVVVPGDFRVNGTGVLRYLSGGLSLSLDDLAWYKTGVGPTTFIDSGLFETDTGRWVVAAMASEIEELTTRPGDPVPVAFGEIGYALHQAWGQ